MILYHLGAGTRQTKKGEVWRDAGRENPEGDNLAVSIPNYCTEQPAVRFCRRTRGPRTRLCRQRAGLFILSRDRQEAKCLLASRLLKIRYSFCVNRPPTFGTGLSRQVRLRRFSGADAISRRPQQSDHSEQERQFLPPCDLFQEPRTRRSAILDRSAMSIVPLPFMSPARNLAPSSVLLPVR